MARLSSGIKLSEYQTPQQIAKNANIVDIYDWARIKGETDYDTSVMVDIPTPNYGPNTMAVGVVIWGIALVVGLIASSWGVFFGIFFIGSILILTGVGLLSIDEAKIVKKKYKKQLLAFAEKAEQAIPFAFEMYVNKFPVQKFYEACLEAEVKKLTTDYEIKKAEAILAEMVKPFFKTHPLYKSLQPMIPDLYKKGKDAHRGYTAVEADRQKKWNATPHSGKPNKEERKEIDQARATKPLKDIEKRKYILKTSRNEIGTEIFNKMQGEEALRQLGGILATSVSQTKTSDWAFLGGIADGLAGPGAGAAVALNVMAENAKIEAENQRKREGALKIVHGFQNDSLRISAERSDLEKAASILDNELKELEKKVSLYDVTADTFATDFKILKKSIEKTETNLLKVKIELQNLSTPSVPKSVHTTADGTITAKIYNGKTYVGEAIVPLPLYGIECGKTETIIGYCPMYMEGNRRYTIEIEPNNLWIMEL